MRVLFAQLAAPTFEPEDQRSNVPLAAGNWHPSRRRGSAPAASRPRSSTGGSSTAPATRRSRGSSPSAHPTCCAPRSIVGLRSGRSRCSRARSGPARNVGDRRRPRGREGKCLPRRARGDRVRSRRGRRGEELLVEVLEARLAGRPFVGIPGLGVATSRGAVEWAPPREPVRDLASLPSPYLGESVRLAAGGIQHIETARGCAFECDFCFYHADFRKVRRFPAERVASEIRFALARGVDDLYLMDPTFNGHAGYRETLASLRAELLDRGRASTPSSAPSRWMPRMRARSPAPGSRAWRWGSRPRRRRRSPRWGAPSSAPASRAAAASSWAPGSGSRSARSWGFPTIRPRGWRRRSSTRGASAATARSRCRSSFRCFRPRSCASGPHCWGSNTVPIRRTRCCDPQLSTKGDPRHARPLLGDLRARPRSDRAHAPRRAGARNRRSSPRGRPPPDFRAARPRRRNPAIGRGAGSRGSRRVGRLCGVPRARPGALERRALAFLRPIREANPHGLLEAAFEIDAPADLPRVARAIRAALPPVEGHYWNEHLRYLAPPGPTCRCGSRRSCRSPRSRPGGEASPPNSQLSSGRPSESPAALRALLDGPFELGSLLLDTPGSLGNAGAAPFEALAAEAGDDAAELRFADGRAQRAVERAAGLHETPPETIALLGAGGRVVAIRRFHG